MSVCTLCPRECGVDRAVARGACGVGETLLISRAALHFGEEPCLASGGGSGAVFFCGCALGCVFCQNYEISHCRNFGREVGEDAFCEMLWRLQEAGAENIDLVTASHFIPALVPALEKARKKLRVPIVFNCSGYEKVSQIKLLEGLVDVYLPDFKFVSSALSARLCRAPNYAEVAEAAISEMYRQVGDCVFDETGKLLRGVLVRHLVLPSHAADSFAVLETLARLFPQRGAIRLSLMRQFTPMEECFEADLSRPVTTLEYRRICERASALGFLGYTQEKASVGRDAIPLFDLSGVE